jgi:hypothetical protein
LHRRIGQGRVIALSGAWRSAELQVALEGFSADDEVAGQAVTRQAQRLEHVIVAPVVGIGRQPEFGMGVGKVAAHESLGAHIGQEPG